mgnify:FL=1
MFNTERLKEIKELKDKLEAEEKEIKAEILEELKKLGKDNYKDEYAELSIVAATQTVSIDVKAIEKADADLYVKLMSDYPKVTKRAGYLRVKVL